MCWGVVSYMVCYIANRLHLHDLCFLVNFQEEFMDVALSTNLLVFEYTIGVILILSCGRKFRLLETSVILYFWTIGEMSYSYMIFEGCRA